MLSILLIAAALCYTFGQMVGDTRQGWAVLAAMLVIFVPLLLLGYWAEQVGQSRRWPPSASIRRPATSSPAETWKARRSASASPSRRSGRRPPRPPATAASTRCTIRYTPLGGLVPMWLMQLGEVVFGGVGSGLYGMLVFAIIAVFIAGLMVGRTPEYLGKKIEAFEMKMAALVILIPPMVVLVGAAVAVATDAGKVGHLQLRRPARLQRSALRLLVGRQQQRQRLRRPEREYAVLQHRAWRSRCSWPATGWRFPRWRSPDRWRERRPRPPAPARCRRTRRCSWCLLVGVVILVGALTFIPALALGPIVEHLMMIGG